MNPEIHDAFANAILADASYVNGLLPEMTGKALADSLGPRLTDTIAVYVGDNFKVVGQYTYIRPRVPRISARSLALVQLPQVEPCGLLR